jgi:predicted small lipoprotein YifL
MFSLRKFGLIVAVIALANLAGCGQYGPLYLPDRPAPSRDPSQDDDFNALPPALDKSRQP